MHPDPWSNAFLLGNYEAADKGPVDLFGQGASVNMFIQLLE